MGLLHTYSVLPEPIYDHGHSSHLPYIPADGLSEVHHRLCAGEKRFLAAQYGSGRGRTELSKQYFGAYELQKGSYRLQGYQFDFTPFLKRFLIRYNGESSYSVVFALNKTNIFDNMYISRNQINDIIEDARHIVVGG